MMSGNSVPTHPPTPGLMGHHTQAFQYFQATEHLSPDESWFCPACQGHREATKQLTLWRVPP